MTEPFREIDRLVAENADLKETNANLRSIADSKDKILAEVVAINEELLAALVSINEYWNGSESRDAMWNACNEMTERASRAIAHATATTPSENL